MSDETPPTVTHSSGAHGGHDEKLERKPMSKVWLAAWFFLGLLASALLVGFIYIVVATWQAAHSSDDTTQAIRATQQTNTKNSKATTEILELIKSCVTPDGECAKRGAKNQASFAGVLNQYNVLSASCASYLTLKGLPPGINQDQLTRMITACVVKQLDDAHDTIKDQQ